MIQKIILVFKTHFDIGFTDLSANVMEKCATTMLRDVIETCAATEGQGRQKFVWTLPAWPLVQMLRQCGDADRQILERLIVQDQIVWHALPFTSHTDFCSAEEIIEGLRFARELSETYEKPFPISAKMTDVPGHGIMLPGILAGAGVKFLHLGCNQFATSPKVPFLFHWQAIGGESVLTMYSKGGYGTSLFPPEDWPFPVWMALMQTDDNHGPQTAADLARLLADVRRKFPDVEVVCGTMDEFVTDLSACDLSTLPVVGKDLADTWIHGVGTYPAEVAMVREERQRSRRLQALYAKRVLEGTSPIEYTPAQEMEILDQYYEKVDLFHEHTWGADVKTWLRADRVYRKKEFNTARHLEKYRFMEKSWQEQKDRAVSCVRSIRELKLLMETANGELSLFNPHNAPFSGWVTLENPEADLSDCCLSCRGKTLPVTRINGKWGCYVENLPPFVTVPILILREKPVITSLSMHIGQESVIVENHRYRMTFTKADGAISELFDKKRDSVLLQAGDGKSVFAYQYDRYGSEDVTTYIRDYAYRFYPWGIQDNGREGYPECTHKTYEPIFQAWTVEQDTVIFHFTGAESVHKYGDAQRIRLEVTFPPVGDELFVQLHLSAKQETPFIESGSFLVPFAEAAPQYRINKSNALLNPETDIQEGANHALYCLENHISVMGETGGFCIIPMDAALVALGDTGIYRFRNTFGTPETPVLYFNLFNNMWGTNFPQWIGGDASYRYILFGFDKDESPSVQERAAVLMEGVEPTCNRLERDLCTFPAHMQLINARQEETGLILRFRDLSGEAASRQLEAKGQAITSIDHNNRVTGNSAKELLTFDVRPYGIHSFLLTALDAPAAASAPE